MTIKEIAAKAGVSIATVSHVINHTRYVSPELVDKIEAIIEESGYSEKIKKKVQKIRSGRSSQIVAVLPNIKSALYCDLCNQLQAYATSQGYQFYTAVSNDNLEEELHELAELQNMTYEDVCIKLKEYYDGYHFVENTIGIYNPFSLLNTFKYNKFSNYWFETGTPSYLVELLKRSHYDLERMANEETSSDVLNSIYADSSNPIPVIYQSGYLTIKSYDEEFGIYQLGFPNREVEEGFVRYLMPFYTNINKVESPFEIQKFVSEIRKGQPDAFLRRLQSFFADTPYELARQLELHYQNVLFIVFKLVGFYAQVEYHTSMGRVDLVLKTNDYIYVMEFKLEGTAQDALKQINEKQYALPFATDPRKLFKIGINFSNELRNIEEWIIEE